MAAATYADVGVALGRSITSTDEQNQIEWWLTGVEMAIQTRLGDVDNLNQDALLYVEAEAVAGKVRRQGIPESSITVSVDDGSVTRRYDSPAGSADMTDEWWNLLEPSESAPAFTVSPYATRQRPISEWRCW